MITTNHKVRCKFDILFQMIFNLIQIFTMLQVPTISLLQGL